MSVKIYKITAGDKVYVGSTVQKLEYRLKAHLKQNCSVRSILIDDSYSIELIEEVDVESRLHRERYWIEYYGNQAVNIKRPIRSYEEKLQQMKDYHKAHKDSHYKSAKASYEKHKEIRNTERIVCVCGKETTKVNISRHLKSKAHLSKVSQ